MSIPFDHYLIFVSIVTMIVVTPGPNLFLLLNHTPASGKAVGFAMTAGFCAAIMCHATLALIGVGAVIATSATLFTLLKVAGAAYLVWMGVKSLWSLRDAGGAVHAHTGKAGRIDAATAAMRGFVTNLLNPKPAVFYVAAFPQFIGSDGTTFFANGLGLGATHTLIALAFYGIIVALIGAVTNVLARPTVAQAVKATSGAALILLGGRLLVSRNPA